MKFLIFGASGYIGREFVRQLNERKLETRILSSKNGVWQYDTLRYEILYRRPDVIINCAAFTGIKNVQDCESRKSETIQSNVIFPNMLNDICSPTNIILGHFSSGCVFNGYPIGGFKETDSPNLTFQHNNCSFYTGTKAMAEELLYPYNKTYVWRIRLPFDDEVSPRNYLYKLMNFDKMLSGYNTLCHRKESVSACIDTIVKGVPYGIYHVANPQPIRTEDIVELFKKYLPNPKKEYKYFESHLELETISKIPRANTILNVDKLLSCGIPMRPTYQAVEETLKEWRWI